MLYLTKYTFNESFENECVFNVKRSYKDLIQNIPTHSKRQCICT